MSSLRLILASLIYHGRMHLAVALGVAAGTAVLTGALLVGDSMRGSLRHLALDRLGRIDEVLVAQRFFRAALADEMAAEKQFKEHFSAAVPVIMLEASLERQADDDVVRAGRVNLLGGDAPFWELGPGGPPQPPERREIVLNEPLAGGLKAKVGDWVTLRLPELGPIPAESALGRREGTVSGYRLKVAAIVRAEGLGRFSLRSSQQEPLNAYVSLEMLQDRLDKADQANAILVAGKSAGVDPSPESEGVAQKVLQPTLEDYGIKIEKTPQGYFNITSDRMLLQPGTEKELLKALDGLEVQPALTYLANTIACDGRETPYSTIAAVDFAKKPPLGPMVTPDGQTISTPGEDEIVLNSWTADDLGAQPGDVIKVTFFEPESTHGQLRTRTIERKLAAVAELAGAADDRAFTPEVAGVTDQLAMTAWNPPFPFDSRRIRDKDETYWNEHGAAPKAFVSLADGRELWASRFGQTTSLRVRPADGMTLTMLRGRLKLDPAAMGFVLQPVKRQALAASSGTTPFDVLFLAFSFFIIVAAVMLVALLFRLGIEQRAEQLGILVAVGYSRRRVVRLLAGEGLIVAALGSLVGVPVGVGYAALMLYGLRTWWVGAVVTPFLELHPTWTSLAIGLFAGVLVAWLTIFWAVRRTRRVAPRQLLAGSAAVETPWRRRSPLAGILAWGMLLAAVGLGLFASRLGEDVQAGAFFGTGVLVLAGCLTMVWNRLRRGATGPAVAAGRGNLLRMALRNAARHPGRSTLTIGLVGATSFLIVAISAFYLDPSQQTPTLDSGNGGFSLVALSDQPVFQDINTPEGRFDLGISEKDTQTLSEARTFALRVKAGDDASCLNLYQARQPRVLGVPSDFLERGGFAWAGTAAGSTEEEEDPWLLLEKDLGTDADGTPLVPVVIDMNTAMYALHLYDGVGATYDIVDGRGRTMRLKVVGLLAGSIFQGDLLISEAAFLDHFPEVGGYRFFLTETEPAQVDAVQNALEDGLGDYGLSSETTGRRLARLLAVQNTYLSTFQSLGGLGLLLGTFGLAAAQLRNVLERRNELALLRAAGFRRRSLAGMVMLENAVLLLAGLVSGLVAAVVAVLPHLLGRASLIPRLSLAVMLLLVLLVGLAAGLIAVRATLRAPLLAELKQEH